MELRPMVTSRDKRGKSPTASVGALASGRSLGACAGLPITNSDEATVATRSTERT